VFYLIRPRLIWLQEITSMNSPRTKLAAIRKGKKDVQAGRIVSHKKTARWLRSWGKKRELSPPSGE
jgi:predicted transcriptional regulator